jgi:hypothetical protein
VLSCYIVCCNNTFITELCMPSELWFTYVYLSLILADHYFSLIYRGYSSFSINTWFIFIEWYENKYFMSGGSHEW